MLNFDESEVQWQMSISNACRYCEGFCAVFPAMTRCLEFAQAGQYAAPHEFAINVPKVMAKIRLDTYAEYGRR